MKTKKKVAKKKSVQRKNVGQKVRDKVIIQKNRVVIEPVEVKDEQKKDST